MLTGQQQTGEAERIAVDHVARVLQEDASSSSAQRAWSQRAQAPELTRLPPHPSELAPAGDAERRHHAGLACARAA